MKGTKAPSKEDQRRTYIRRLLSGESDRSARGELPSLKRKSYSEMIGLSHFKFMAIPEELSIKDKVEPVRLTTLSIHQCPICSQRLYDTRNDGIYYYCKTCERQFLTCSLTLHDTKQNIKAAVKKYLLLPDSKKKTYFDP